MCLACSFNPLAYSANSTPNAETISRINVDFPIYGGSGGNSSTSQGATSNQNINGVLSGVKWSGGTLSYSFPTSAGHYEAGYSEASAAGFSGATEALKTATRAVMNMVSQYTNLVTTEVAADQAADIRSAFSSSANPTAYAYYPSNATKGGDVWYGTDYTVYQNPIKGQYAYTTVIHELGHALGLKHGHETGGPGNTAVSSAFDQMAYTVMTYRSYQNGPTSGYTNETNGYAQTFMMYDIAALQTMYGANFNTNAGNTTYSWSSTTGEMFIDGVGQGAPGGNRIFMTIWDGNGIDTYDFSNYSSNMTIDLTPGSFSITSSTQRASLGGGNTAPGNIFNALQFNGDARSLIENAIGGSGGDSITGNAADNLLLGMGGSDTLSGGAGSDTLIGDGPVQWDTAAAAIRRLYLATLDRAPDDSGHKGWTGALLGGQSLQSIATGFINSTEFQTKYGALDNTQFVTLLYRNVLGREPDAGGLSGWVGALNSGQSREFVVTGFSDSTEFQVKTDIREHAGQIYRLYDSCFNRGPDTNGFWGWVDSRYGNTKLTDMATQFMNSAEFTNTYGSINNMSNAQFVELLYNNVLNRASDAAGAAGWIQALTSGSMTRADVLLAFSDSNEHINLMNTGLQTFMRNDTTGRNDTLYGGTGDDKLTGRFGSDLFRFNAADGGTDTVYGFEVFDRLQFTGFGFSNANDALAKMTQQGNHVIFTHNNNTIVFADTQLSVLQNMTSSGWVFA